MAAPREHPHRRPWRSPDGDQAAPLLGPPAGTEPAPPHLSHCSPAPPSPLPGAATADQIRTRPRPSRRGRSLCPTDTGQPAHSRVAPAPPTMLRTLINPDSEERNVVPTEGIISFFRLVFCSDRQPGTPIIRPGAR